MSKLYIFGIGGTGSRVIKSLTMLLAAGVDCGVDTIVPIIIDRDASNEDLSRTELLIKDYVEANKIAETNERNKFFKTRIELLDNKLCLQLVDNTQNFEDFIGKRSMSKENQALVDMLFSKETLKMDMTAGFQGNPNIGSVVLNQFESSPVFKAFAKDFKDGDKIFIISSIFGGTGASGFPLLRKIIHTPNVKDSDGVVLDNWGLINSALIGAISVLPYFTVKSATDNSLVNSDTFIDKARAALSYYKTEDKNIDTLYYIADKQTTSYEHNKGGETQRNNAHFAELAAALSILDFVNPEKKNENIHRDERGKIEKTTYKEFGIQSNALEINFDNLTDETRALLINPLSRFLLFRNYMKYAFDEQHKCQPYACKRFTGNFRRIDAVRKMESVQDRFYEWLKEMGDQYHKFVPFNLTSHNALDFIKGNVHYIQSRSFKYKNWAIVDNELNYQIGKIKKTSENEKIFIELFFRMSEALIKYKD
ncbi:hypothetical protein [Bacteroides sp. 224]|uniref:hypothetical protein n=1 Tax=Bacteroides sp. 224 TaxID=2302936 RepID=UPI0013D7908B|nr:hypothetical protein [Bacteroides sp. 224]NDV65647.1 hypothetical protein [Bacteroides sp. 224]